MKCTQRLYLTQDRETVVPAGHDDAHTLYAVPGDEIPQSAVDKFGLVDGHLEGFDPDAIPEAAEVEPKQAEPTVTATQTLYHSSVSPDSLVGEDDPAADVLYAKAGDQIPQNAHDGYGLVDGALPVPEPAVGTKEDAGSSKDKERKSGADKEQKPGDNKSESGGGEPVKSGEQA